MWAFEHAFVCVSHVWETGPLVSLALPRRRPVAPFALPEALMKMTKWGSATPLFRAYKSFCQPLCSSRALFCKHVYSSAREQGGALWFGWAAGSLDVWIEWLSGFRLQPFLLILSHQAGMQQWGIELVSNGFLKSSDRFYLRKKNKKHMLICVRSRSVQ